MPNFPRLGAGLWTAALAGALMLPAAPASAALAAVAPAASATATTYRFGAWAKSADDVPRLSALMGRPLTSLRVYYDTPPVAWQTTSGLLGALPSNGTVSISFHHGTPAQVQTFLAGHPSTVKCYATYYHEPEFVFTTPAQQAQFRAAFASYAPGIRAAGCLPTLILHNWVMHDPARDWHNWYPAGSVDVLGFDAYNLTAPQGVYPRPAVFLAPFIAASRETGLPWAMPEIGSFITPGGLTSASRATWAHEVAAAAAADPGFRFANWWDAIGLDQSKDFTMDGALATVWHR